MLPFLRIVPRTQGVFIRRIYSGISKPVVESSAHEFGQIRNAATGRLLNGEEMVSVEGLQGEQQEFPVSEARRVMHLAAEYQCEGPSIQGTQEVQDYSHPGLMDHESSFETCDDLSKEDVHFSVFEGPRSHVSLNGCMQSTVPNPLNSVSSTSSGYQSYLNMPGGGGKLLDKYLSGSSQVCHQSRNFSTSSRQWTSQQGAQEMTFVEEEYLSDPAPQGIQGDNCVQFRLWMENCQRYDLPNCDEQLESITTGRKTLAQVFHEQQEIIRIVAESYKNNLRQSQNQMDSETNAQGQQDYFGYSFRLSSADPCPQGLQGDDCANYVAWAHNCRAFGFGNCNEKLLDIQTGRRTLQDVFDEQDQMIRKIVTDFQQKRSYSTSSKPEVGKPNNSDTDSTSPHSTLPGDLPKLSQKDRLKRAVKQYGGTVIVFHIGISLISLGGFYLAVSSGLDVAAILTKLGVSEAMLQSKIATGSTTFVMAYAVHKVFAPARIAITLSCTPFIVGYLRRVGFLKPPKI